MKKKLLNKLIDKYENSKSFIGQNKVNQKFSVNPSKLFPKYSNDAEVEFFSDLNESIRDLEKTELVSVDWLRGGVAGSVSLNIRNLDAAYKYIGRQPRKQIQERVLSIMNEYQESACPLLSDFILAQKKRIELNQNVEYFNSDENDFKNLIRAVDFIQKNEDEILIRNASLSLFRDSKQLETMVPTIESLMRKYGDYEGCEDILAECNVVKTPTQVLVKGNAILNLKGQILDLSKMDGDIGLSTKSLKDVLSVNVLGNRVVTIENLTSFYTYGNRNDFVIYLGGFHNSVKRDFVKKVFAENASESYMHFGDIDAGGLYILRHLRNKTGIKFAPMNMDVETLKKYDSCVKSLTKEDLARLKRLKEDAEFDNLISYMLEHNCKLEQENVVA
ncbi:Wadjet anti-phage system protein JetD domain-containing protein [uncultured Fibrobacter sp.]|uniref:Wadjet anti-phage system protein JetD domain-containing protein n=1 Tax=uncultured Fibrobacter sp. TaxID=261512 RepID=UPI0025D89F6B|nr:Wadjet anti-phage system protein JetD domain-containing protein [uncultured Fibrobacter sp.]